MIVEVAPFLMSIGGNMDKDHYLRPLPGRPGMAAVCKKPRYSKSRKAEMAQTKVASDFADMQSEAKRQYRDPVLREEWAKKHREALKEAGKHHTGVNKDGKPFVAVRLWDYIRHELRKQKEV